MKPAENIEKIAHIAKREQAPLLDVTENVMYEINILTEQNQQSFIPFDFVAGLSALAASIITAISTNSWFSILNPVMRLFTPIQEIALW